MIDVNQILDGHTTAEWSSLEADRMELTRVKDQINQLQVRREAIEKKILKFFQEKNDYSSNPNAD